MPARPGSPVRALRERRGLTQVALAERSRLTRQSLSAIEAGRATPAVDVALRVASALGCTVEELFGRPEEEPELEVALAGEGPAPRVALAWVRDRWVGLPLGQEQLRTSADALVVSSRGRRATVAPLCPPTAARENLALMGCATGLGLLVDRLNARRGAGRFVWCPSSTGAALRALTAGNVHLAGVHRATEQGAKDANVAAVRRAESGEALVLVTLATWQAGLLTRSGDTRVRGVTDLAAPRLRVAARERGAGARELLEQRLRAERVPLAPLDRAAIVATGHLEVARAVALGAADVGLATRDAALAFGLRFVPLAEERYDLVVPRALLGDARVERLLDTMVSRECRRELEALGYDVSGCGARVAELEAA